MRFLWLIIPILLVFNGCGTAPKKYKPVPKPKVFDGKSLGNSIYYYSKQDLIKVATNNYKYLSNADDVKRLLLDVGFVKRVGNQTILAKLDALNYDLNEDRRKLEIKSFTYNSDKKEYLLSGRYVYTNVIFAEGKTNRYDWPIRFIALYDEATKELKGMYYNTQDKFNQTIISNNAKVAWFSGFHGGIFLNLDTNKTKRLSKVPFYTYDNTKYAFSKNGNYFGKLLTDTKHGGKDVGLLVYDIKNGKTIFNKTFYFKEYAASEFDFIFSEDEKYFIYKTKNDPFKVYDLVQKKEIARFGKNFLKTNWPSLKISGEYLFASIHSAGKKDEKSIFRVYVYDMKNNESFCEMDNIPGMNMFVQNDVLNVIRGWGSHEVFNFEKNNCFRVESFPIDKKLYPEPKVLTYTHNNTTYYFKNGIVSTRYIPKQYTISKEKKDAFEKIEKIQKYFQAGFVKRGKKELKDIVLNEKYDFYGLAYNRINSFLPLEQEVYFNVLGFQRYMKNNQDISYYHFHRAIRNYIFIASARGFKDLAPSMIAQYKNLIGANPKKEYRDMLAAYEANYLLDIGKDDEAYEILFDHAPLHEKVQEQISKFSSYPIGLMKDRKKLSVAAGIDEKSFKKPLKFKPLSNFYDLEGNEVSKGTSAQKIEKQLVIPQVEKAAPKQDAIKLLD